MFFSKLPLKPDPPSERVEPRLTGLALPPQPTNDELHKQIEHLTRIAVRTETRLCMLIERMGIKGIIN